MYSDDELYDMDDAALEAAFKEAKANADSSEVLEQMNDETAELPPEQEVEDSVDEEYESDTEQPEEDSDHDTSEEDGEVDTDSEEPEATEDDPDGDSDVDEDNSEEDEETEAEAPQPVEQLSFKANGAEYKFTPEEILQQFPKVFGQAMDYTKKMQAIKPWRKTIDAMEQAKLDHNDVNLMIDVLKGDKDAIAEVIKRTGVDTLDLDTENSNYVANDYGRDEKALNIKEVVEEIAQDPEYDKTQSILSRQWDESSWQTMSEDPKMIKLLHEDVKSGIFDQVKPIMDKLKLFDGGAKKSDLEYYGQAAREYYDGIAQQQAAQQAAYAKAQQDQVAQQEREAARVAEIKAQEQARSAAKAASSKRKAAAPSKPMSGNKAAGVVDYLNASDEEFERWQAEIERKI